MTAERALAAAMRDAERYIRAHGVGAEPGHGSILTSVQQEAPAWIEIRDRLDAARRAAWGPPLLLAPWVPVGGQLELFPTERRR